MKLQLGSIGDHAQTTIIVEHVDLVGVPIVEDMKKKKEHNQAILEIASFSTMLNLLTSMDVPLQ